MNQLKGLREQLSNSEKKISPMTLDLDPSILSGISDQYISRLCDDVKKNIFLNRDLMLLSCKSANDDIKRYQSYHLQDTSISNSVKSSAYLCKWVSRFRPIQICGSIKSKELLLINSALALYFAQLLISAELRVSFFYTPKYFNEFQYDLLYRELGTDGLLHVFQNIYSAVTIRRAGILEFA